MAGKPGRQQRETVAKRMGDDMPRIGRNFNRGGEADRRL
jgi:hypothetical protein